MVTFLGEGNKFKKEKGKKTPSKTKAKRFVSYHVRQQPPGL